MREAEKRLGEAAGSAVFVEGEQIDGKTREYSRKRSQMVSCVVYDAAQALPYGNDTI